MTDSTPAPTSFPHAPEPDPIVRRFVVARRARDMAEQLLGLGALRLTEAPVDWFELDTGCAVGSPNSVEGFLLVHAGARPGGGWAARARAKDEAARPELREARARRLFPETTLRLMGVKVTPATESEWMATGMEARARGDFTEVNRLLHAAVRPAKVDEAPAAAPAPAAVSRASPPP